MNAKNQQPTEREMRGTTNWRVLGPAMCVAALLAACDGGGGGESEGGEWQSGSENSGEASEGPSLGGGESTGGQESTGGDGGGPGGETTAEGGTDEGSADGEPADGGGVESPGEGTGEGEGGDGNPDDPNADTDSDLIFDKNDNCPTAKNPGQEDYDLDGIGDVCDVDVDGDGALNTDDCDPFDRDINPMAPEICDGADNNCDGSIDNDAVDGCTLFYPDLDLDNTGATGQGKCLCAPTASHKTPFGGDCNDSDPAVSSFAKEICDGKDNNCNNLTDEGCDDDGDLYCDSELTVVGFPAVCPLGGGDCFDYSALINPAATEVSGDGFDNNCDGVYAGEGGGVEVNCPADCLAVANEVDRFLCGMEMCFPTLITSAAFSSPTGDDISSAKAVTNHFGNTSNDLAPFAGDSYSIISSGPALGTFHSQDLPGFGSKVDTWAKDGFATYDNVEFKVTMTAPQNAIGFSIDYIFLSAEYMEFVGSEYNDKFYMILNNQTVINYTDCSSPNTYFDFVDPNSGKKQCYIAINTAFSEVCGVSTPTSIAGTGYECRGFGGAGPGDGSSTGWLTTSWPIQGGATFTLVFHIHDTSDGVYDSTVVLDNFQFITDGSTFKPGTTNAN